jgi:hypothetical protein
MDNISALKMKHETKYMERLSSTCDALEIISREYNVVKAYT